MCPESPVVESVVKLVSEPSELGLAPRGRTASDSACPSARTLIASCGVVGGLMDGGVWEMVM